MYFVTTKHADYVLFCMTPSERAAIGVTEKHTVHLLQRGGDDVWQVVREWPVAEYSHTDLMAALGGVSEPADPLELVRFLPPHLRG
jgi:hypothetical protein